MKLSYLPLLLLVTKGMESQAKGGELVDPYSAIRHSFNTKPLELNVDAKETYNDKFMALMESSCRPESDGYFGATYGEPVIITYGFQLEAQPLSPIMDLLDIVEDKFMDDVLSEMYPELCGFRRRRLTHHASGLKFYKFHEEERCDPTIDPTNFCGLFKGQVNVYGREQDKSSLEVIKLIDATLNPSDPTKLHPELVGISSVAQYLEVTGGNVQVQQEKTHRILVWTGIIGVGVLFFIIVWWFFIRNEKQGDTGASNGKREGSWGSLRSTAPYFDPEEKSIKPSMEPEADVFASSGPQRSVDAGGPMLYDHQGRDSLRYRDDLEDYDEEVLDDVDDYDDYDDYDDDESSVSATAEIL